MDAKAIAKIIDDNALLACKRASAMFGATTGSTRARVAAGFLSRLSVMSVPPAARPTLANTCSVIDHHAEVNAAMWRLAQQLGLREEVDGILQELAAADRSALRPLHLRPKP